VPGYGDRTDTTLIPLTGRPPDQVAYVVADLEEGIRRLGPQLGVSRWLGWRYTADYLPQRVFRGEQGDFESHGVIPEYGPSLEIIAPLSGPGLHHLGYFVPSLDEERERLVAQGLSEVQYGGGHGMDGDGKISFFETLDGAASYLEIIEPPRRRFPPHFEVRLD
jgi:methylmalonyl-CoA/ethylmalonyl-CoA epimerase